MRTSLVRTHGRSGEYPACVACCLPVHMPHTSGITRASLLRQSRRAATAARARDNEDRHPHVAHRPVLTPAIDVPARGRNTGAPGKPLCTLAPTLNARRGDSRCGLCETSGTEPDSVRGWLDANTSLPIVRPTTMLAQALGVLARGVQTLAGSEFAGVLPPPHVGPKRSKDHLLGHLLHTISDRGPRPAFWIWERRSEPPWTLGGQYENAHVPFLNGSRPHAATHMCEHICIYGRIYAYMPAFTRICKHIRIYARIDAYMRICSYMHAYTQAYTPKFPNFPNVFKISQNFRNSQNVQNFQNFQGIYLPSGDRLITQDGGGI